jgi:hypothetical protein
LGYVRAIVHTIYAEKLITAAKLIKKSFPAKQSLQKRHFPDKQAIKMTG